MKVEMDKQNLQQLTVFLHNFSISERCECVSALRLWEGEYKTVQRTLFTTLLQHAQENQVFRIHIMVRLRVV